MCDQSEIDELYDEFLDLDGNPFIDVNLDSKIIGQDLSRTELDVDAKWNLTNISDIHSNIQNNNNRESDSDSYMSRDNINSINNNHISIKKVFGETDISDLDLLNQNSFDGVGLFLDKNGKAQNKNDFSLKFSSVRPSRPTSLFTKVKECEVDTELKEVDEQRTSPDEPPNDLAFHHNDWGPESLGLWHSGPSSLSLGHSTSKCNAKQDLCNDVTFSTSMGADSQALGSFSSSTRRSYSHQQLGAKVEMVYSLLSMLGTSNRNDMSKTLLAMSSSPESCLAMRQSGCLPLLIQLIHSPELDIEVRCRAAEALQNIVLAQTDEKKRRREARVLKLLQQIREYCDDLKILATNHSSTVQDEPEKHPVAAMEALMKFSFDAEHRLAMCSLGGLHAIAELIQLDHEVHGSMSDNPLCITLRRYASMALTNLIFGDGNNKALLCSFNKFMKALVSQLMSPSEDLRLVTASVLRNLSWRADSESKQALREIGAVTALMVAAMEGKKESTLKSILSALWNLSGHCSMNKVDVCAVPGAVAFLVKMLKYKAASNTLAVVENAGGILRNISSHIAVREDYRQILRDNNCFEILLEQLKSSSLTIVSNACGTLWNLSARCTEDQRKLWEMGAISMLRSLIQSKHKMISMGSSAALKNLLSANPGGNMFNHMDSTAKSLGLQTLPTLFVRKQRALEQELDINLSETCDNIEPNGSPVHSEKSLVRPDERKGNISKRSDSHESVTSTQSDSAYERVNQLIVKNENKILENKNTTMHGSLSENQSVRRADEQKLMRRYKSSMIPTPAFRKLTQEKKNEKTKDDNSKLELAEKQSELNQHSKKSVETKEKRGIPVLKNRIKSENETQGLDVTFSQPYSRSDFHTKDEEEFPVNYSLKYSETGVYNRQMNNQNRQTSQENLKEKENFEGYPDYAETDLDQPTDFSLKYGEETSSDEELKNQAFTYFEGDKTKESGYYSGQPDSEDTTRTYYTEDTPYEGTPYNYSMSDLRIDHSEIRENGESDFQDEKGDSRKLTPEDSSRASSANEKQCQNLCVNNSRDFQSRVKSLPRDFESGVSTPERPTLYCEEGTPGGCFSRVSSLSSLSGGKESSNKTSPDNLEKKSGVKDLQKSIKHLDNEESLQNKAVKFGVTQQYECADETPLMFSRSSSINSLSSFEEIHQSIPDDRSSIVSDFSRMTSGIISPSELPDSPTQTVSHAGSHSDLTMVTHGILLPPTMKDTSDDCSFCSGDTENMLAECIQSGMPKAKQKEKSKNSNVGNTINLNRMERANVSANKVQSGRLGVINTNLYAGHQNCTDYLRRKDHHLTAKDETSTFATENSPCNFSVRSSLSDLTVNSVDSPGCLSRPEVNRDQMSQVLPSAQAPNASSHSICMIESEKEGKNSEENRTLFNVSKKVENDASCWEKRKSSQSKNNSETSYSTANELSENAATVLSRHESLSSLSVESFDSSEPTPLEQALLEQCIHSGMPHKTHSREIKNYKSYDETRMIHMRNVSMTDAGSNSEVPKNVHISSATVEESTEADEVNVMRIVEGQENSKAIDLTISDSISSKCQYYSPKRECDIKDANDMVDGNHGENLNSSYGGHTWSDDYTSPNENSITFTSTSGKVEGLKVVGDSDNSVTKDEVLLPNFKIGSEVRDPKFLQAEASKICREIRKYQEFDMNCSITSEVSQVSCSSFLDSGEFSFIDLSKETGELDGSESLSHSKAQRKANNRSLRTSITALEEPISLPSIGSVKSDLLQDIDLESSILSVASLTSEVAENISRDKDGGYYNGDKTPENALDSPITVFDRGDDTLNAETIGSDTEIFDDENSTMSQENLPLDSEEPKELTPKRMSKKLTPKEKRQVLQDRFRTYTIHDFKSCGNPEADEPDEQRKKKTTPKERRMNERDRFLTRVLGKDNTNSKVEEDVLQCVDVENSLESNNENNQVIDTSTLVLKKRVSLDCFESNNIEKEHNRSGKVSEGNSSVNDLVLPVSPAERKEILDNAKLVAISLKTAIHDADTELGFVSDSDAEGSHKTFAIDTATYNKTVPTEIYYKLSEDECESNEETKESDDEFEKKGPRILKPGEKSQEEANESAAKAIRGRRKQMYSSPAKRNVVQMTTNSMPASPKITAGVFNARKLSFATTKSLPNVPKSIQKTDSPILCREGTFTKEEVVIPKQSCIKQPRSIPVFHKKLESKSSNTNTAPRTKITPPILRNTRCSTDNIKPGRPATSYIAKSSDKFGSGSSNLNRHSSGSGGLANSKVSGNVSALNDKKFSSSGPNTFMRSSSSNQSIKNISNVKSTSSVRAKSAVLQSTKSLSYGSLDSDQSSDKTGNKGKPKTPKKEVTSKIASLWKKVEDTKRREKNVKDNRVWITSEKNAKTDNEETVIEKEEILELSSGKVVRSSTFQALGEDSPSVSSTDDLRKKHRNSGDFYSSQWQTEKNGNFEGRISAIVPPYNYSPPGKAQLTSPTIKQTDTYHKSSMKVTTV